MTTIRFNYSYQFFRDSLRIQISWASYRLKLSLGYKITRFDQRGNPLWDGSRCKRNSSHGPKFTPASLINAALEDLENRIQQALYNFSRNDQTPTPQELKQILTPEKVKPEQPANLHHAFLTFLREGETLRQWSDNTQKTVRNVGNILKKFRPSLSPKDITPDFIDQFIAFQASNRLSANNFKTGQTGYSNASAIKNARTLRWFLSWATQKQIISKEQWEPRKLEIKKIPRPVIFLTAEELRRLENAEFYPGSEEERAADFFLFCCFSSLRYSDAAALLKTSIQEDSFTIITQKTATPLVIDLNDHTRRILSKYADQPGPYALPRITNNRLNQLIKAIGEVLNIDTPIQVSQYYGNQRIDRTLPKWQLLSTHTARRTFISQALMLGIPPQVVMKWTGHSEYSAMRPYIEIADSTKSQAMTHFNDL